jgi:hypothetical protein
LHYGFELIKTCVTILDWLWLKGNLNYVSKGKIWISVLLWRWSGREGWKRINIIVSNFKDVGAKRKEIWWGELFNIFVLIWLFDFIFEPMYVQFCWSNENNDDFVLFLGQNCVCSMDLYGE